ncbi:MAG: ABC transporter permease [Chloroherpetonaceae bacterium]
MTPSSLIAIESIKTTRAVSFWVSLGIFALFSSFMLWFSFFATTVVNGQEVSNMLLPRDWARLLSQFKGLQIIFVPISLILLTASEFTFKTARQNVIDGLSRESFLISKLLTTFALTLLYFLLTLVLGTLFNLGATDTEPTQTARAFISTHELVLFGTYLLALLGYGFLGLFFAFLTRSTGSAIAFYVLYLVLEGLAGGLLQFSNTLKPLVKFFPTKVFDDLVNPFRFDSESLADLQSQIKRAEEMGQTIPDAVYAQLPQFESEVGFLLALLYIGLIGGATYLLFKQRDL